MPRALERYPKTWIGFALDLTERKRSEAALQEAKEAAESASRAKDQFLAMLSHELRTPLTPVLLMATAMLEEPDTPAEIRTMLELTRRNVQLEARLIDDLLDITRISRGKLDLNREHVNAHALIQQALEICRDDIRTNELQLSLELAADEHHVDGDPARLQQVFWNLIKNAVKFTPRGEPVDPLVPRRPVSERHRLPVCGRSDWIPASGSSRTPCRRFSTRSSRGFRHPPAVRRASGLDWRSADRSSRPTAADSRRSSRGQGSRCQFHSRVVHGPRSHSGDSSPSLVADGTDASSFEDPPGGGQQGNPALPVLDLGPTPAQGLHGRLHVGGT